MNNVILIGRLTKNIELRYGTDSQKAFARFTVAIDRGKTKDGKDLGSDFVSCVAFGKTAENMERFLKKGLQVCVQGHIHTDKYEKDGKTIYTTDVYADRIEFIEWADKKKEAPAEDDIPVPSGYTRITDDDISF